MLGDGLDKPISPQMTWIGWSHNPEVAGSNPAPAIAKGAGNGAFPFRHIRLGRDFCPNFCLGAGSPPGRKLPPRF